MQTDGGNKCWGEKVGTLMYENNMVAQNADRVLWVAEFRELGGNMIGLMEERL